MRERRAVIAQGKRVIIKPVEMTEAHAARFFCWGAHAARVSGLAARRHDFPAGTPENTPGTGMLPGSSAAGRGVNPQKCFSPQTPRLPRSLPRASSFGLPLAGDPAGTRQHVFCARKRRIPGKFLSRVLSRAIGVAVLCAMMHPAAGLAEPPRWNLRYTGAVPQLNLEWK